MAKINNKSNSKKLEDAKEKIIVDLVKETERIIMENFKDQKFESHEDRNQWIIEQCKLHGTANYMKNIMGIS